jgi:hypothetical protein
LASAGNIRDACRVLDVIVRQEPNHVEAWEFYMQASTSDRTSLENLGSRVAVSHSMLPDVKREVLDYHRYLLRRLDGRERSRIQRRVFILRIALGALLGVGIFLLRDTIPMTIPVSLLIGLAAALLLADWIRKNNPIGIPARRGMIRSFAHESKLVKIEESKVHLLHQDQDPAPPETGTSRRSRRETGLGVGPARPKVVLRSPGLPKVPTRKIPPRPRSRVKLK